jgi:thiol-disulfide isomerase/thioredoxin
MGYPPPGYGPGYGPSPYAQTDGRATASMVLGILSLVCAGLLTGVPAVILGFMARGDIARSEGAKTGAGLALAGIVTGAIGTLISFVSLAFMGVGIIMGMAGAPRSAPTPPPVAPGAPAPAPPGVHAPHAPATATTHGSITVLDLDPADGPLRTQLTRVVAEADARHSPVLVETTASWCPPCQKFKASLEDARVQRALEDVTLVRLDIDTWDSGELSGLHLVVNSVPWFYKMDASLTPLDKISSDEWGDDVPANIAPVMRDFMAGTLKHKRR